MSDFISKYIATCARKGINSPAEIVRAAEERIKDIDKQLIAADVARSEKNNLQEVIKNFGFSPVKQTKRRKTIINDQISKEDLDPKYVDLANKICDYIDLNSECKVSTLLSVIGSLRADYEVYEVIKWLTITGIISRKEDRTIVKGPLWEQRLNKSN